MLVRNFRGTGIIVLGFGDRLARPMFSSTCHKKVWCGRIEILVFRSGNHYFLRVAAEEMKDLTPFFVELRAASHREPRRGFPFCLKRFLGLLVPKENHSGLPCTCRKSHWHHSQVGLMNAVCTCMDWNGYILQPVLLPCPPLCSTWICQLQKKTRVKGLLDIYQNWINFEN